MKAIIFDMDGVLVNSEPLWQRAEKEVFSAQGVQVTPKLSALTQRMTTQQVAEFWFKQHPWEGKTIAEVKEMVVDRVVELVEEEDCTIPGVLQFIERLKDSGYQLGLATNSPYKVIPAALEKTNLVDCFSSIVSAEFVPQGKPQPDVYLKTLENLQLKPDQCLVIEDSNSGIIAAKRAGMRAAAFTNSNKNHVREEVVFEIDDYRDFDLTLLTGR